MVRGTLYLVVGPSGAGKDSLLDGARERLADNDKVVAKRVIADRPMLAAKTMRRCRRRLRASIENGAFLLHWAAMSLLYFGR